MHKRMAAVFIYCYFRACYQLVLHLLWPPYILLSMLLSLCHKPIKKNPKTQCNQDRLPTWVYNDWVYNGWGWCQYFNRSYCIEWRRMYGSNLGLLVSNLVFRSHSILTVATICRTSLFVISCWALAPHLYSYVAASPATTTFLRSKYLKI